MKRMLLLHIILLLGFAACSGTPARQDALPEVDTGINQDAWVSIPRGSFLMGQHEVETEVDHAYAIMVTDVTNAQFAAFLNEALDSGFVTIVNNTVVGAYPGDVFHGHKHEVEIKAGNWLFIPLEDPALKLSYDGTAFQSRAGYERHPMTGVTWFGAWGYCTFNGWRLPTNIEWEKAARGQDNRPYPWGTAINSGNANYVSSHDIFERTFSDAGGTTPVGFYNGQTYQGYETDASASPYGLYDMAGNVWQWTGDIQTGAHYRNLRGGSYTNYAYNLRIWTHNTADPTHFSTNVGFRCARDG